MSVLLSTLMLFSGCHEQEISRKPKKDTSAKKSVPQATNNTVAQLNEDPDIYLEKPKAIDSQPQERPTPSILNEKPVQKEPISFLLNGELDIDLKGPEAIDSQPQKRSTPFILNVESDIDLEDLKAIDPQPQQEPTPLIDVIFEDQWIDSETLVSYVNEGDEVILHVSGITKRKEFVDYEEVYLSTWIEEECKYQWGGRGQKKHVCSDVRKHGTCKISYRREVDKTESPIDFNRDSEVPLEALINDRSYRFDDIHFHDNSTMILTLKIKREMLEETSELYIKPVNEYLGDIKIGFLGYTDCPGDSQNDFSSGGSTFLELVPDELKKELLVSVEIIRANSD